MKQFSRSEVEAFNGKDGKPLYLIVNGSVLDVSDFKSHPGGRQVLLELAGKDVTKQFYSLHKHSVLEQRKSFLQVGQVKDFESDEPIPWKEISSFPIAEINMNDDSPYYRESHIKLRSNLRKFLWESGTYSWCEKAEMDGEYPSPTLRQTLGKYGILALAHGCGEHLQFVPEPNLWSDSGVTSYKLVDIFHFSILHQEIGRMFTIGASDGLIAGVTIALGPLLQYSNNDKVKQVGKEALRGEKVLCLGVTEPLGGTDVAGIRTTARSDGKGGYIVSGSKKFITQAMQANYCTTLVRTVEKGLLTVLLIPLREENNNNFYPGVTIKPIPAAYSASAGTGLIVFENVSVPGEYRLGEEGDGLKMILRNFNSERMMINAVMLSRSRRLVEEAFLWANQREAFKRTLVDMPVIRLRLGQIVAELNLMDAALERLLFRYSRMTKDEQNDKLGGDTALLKYSITRGTLNICEQVVNIFGGRGSLETGLGCNAHRLMKGLKILSVGGGTEDAMLDLGVRQALRRLPKNARL